MSWLPALPLFVVTGRNRRHPIESLNGHSRVSPDLAVREAQRLAELGVGGVLLFGIPEAKDDVGTGADDPRGKVTFAAADLENLAASSRQEPAHFVARPAEIAVVDRHGWPVGAAARCADTSARSRSNIWNGHK